LSAGERDKEVLKFVTMAAGYNPVLLDFDDSFEDQSEDVDAPQDDRDFCSNNLFKDETCSDPCEVVTSANAKSNQDLDKQSLPPLNPTTGDVQKSLEEKMKQERREFEMALNQKLKTSGVPCHPSSSGLGGRQLSQEEKEEISQSIILDMIPQAMVSRDEAEDISQSIILDLIPRALMRLYVQENSRRSVASSRLPKMQSSGHYDAVPLDFSVDNHGEGRAVQDPEDESDSHEGEESEDDIEIDLPGFNSRPRRTVEETKAQNETTNDQSSTNLQKTSPIRTGDPSHLIDEQLSSSSGARLSDGKIDQVESTETKTTDNKIDKKPLGEKTVFVSQVVKSGDKSKDVVKMERKLVIDNQALKRISEAKEIANNNDLTTVKAKVTPITKPNILLKKPSPESPTASNKQVLKVKIAPKISKGPSSRSLLSKAVPTITTKKEPKSQPNTETSNGEPKDKSALEKASEFATKCLQGLAPLDPKLNAAAGLVKSNQRTTARKSTSNRLQIPNIKPEATSPKSPVKTEPPFQAPKPEEAPSKIAVKAQKKPKANNKVTVKIEEVKPSAPTVPPAPFHSNTNFTDDGKIQTYLLPDGWKKILSRRGSAVAGTWKSFDVYLVAPVPYKKLRSNVDIHKFMSTHPGVPLNPDYVNMEKPIDQTGRTSGKTPSTMKLRQAIRDSGGKVPPPNPKDAVKKTAKKRQSVPASLPPPAVEGGVEFQNLLGHLEPLPFQSVIQSVDFVDVHQAAGAAGESFGHHFLAGGGVQPAAATSVEPTTPPPAPPAKTHRQQANGRQVHPKNTVEHRVAPLVTNYKLPDQWQKVMVTKKLGDGTEKNTIFLYPPGCPKEQKLKNNDELISFMQKNRSVPMNPNFVNFEVPLNSTGRTQLTDKVYLLRHFMEQLLQDQLSNSQSSQLPASSDSGTTKSSSSASTSKPATSSTSGQKRKPVAPLSAAQSKRLKGQSVLSKNSGADATSQVANVDRRKPGPKSRRPVNPDISNSAIPSGVAGASGPLKVSKEMEENFVIEYNHDEEPEVIAID